MAQRLGPAITSGKARQSLGLQETAPRTKSALPTSSRYTKRGTHCRITATWFLLARALRNHPGELLMQFTKGWNRPNSQNVYAREKWDACLPARYTLSVETRQER